MIDCFLFFNELDLLEIRLNSLAPYVEKFVLCESPVTFSGNPKELYFNDNKDRFKDFNIIHLVCNIHNGTPREREAYQRNFLMNGILDVDPETIVLLSDVDEIPDLRNYRGIEGVFRHKVYHYYLNVTTGKRNWKGTIATYKKNIGSLSWIRQRRDRIPSVSRSSNGWHFSYVSSVEDIIVKIESFCEQELNTPEIKARIAENRRNFIDPFNRNQAKYTIEMPLGPKGLVQNKNKYKHLFYGELCQ